MEQVIIQYPVLTWIIWVFLNFLAYYFQFLNYTLYQKLINNFEFKANKKSFLHLLGWLCIGTIILFGFRQAVLQNQGITYYAYFAWIGGLFFFIIGCLVSNIVSLLEYFIHRKEKKKIIYSYCSCIILSSLEYLGYSLLIFSGYFFTRSPFLLGGTIGLAVAGILCIFEINRKIR